MKVVRTCVVGLVAGGLVACAGETGDEELGQTEQGLTLASGSIVSPVVSESADVGGYPINLVEPSTVTLFDLQVAAKVKWQGVFTSALEWDADKVRQGQLLDVKRTGSSLGILKVLWTITGTIRPAGGLFGTINIGTIPFDLDVAGCTPPLDGSPFACSADSPSVTLFDGFLPTTIYVKLRFGIDFDGEGAAASTTRTLYFGDEAGGTASLELTPDQLGDGNAMPCNKPAGTTVDYALDPFSWSPSSLTVTQQPKIVIGFHDPIFSIPIDAFDIPIGPAIVSNPSLTLEGPGNTASLGELQANNVAPTVSSVGPFSGQEGTPVHFSASTTSQCPITSYVWEFSDGTRSFGASPQRAFGDDGQFNGQLTVTDMTNLSGTGNFNVDITNRAPVANAGPNTGGAWGTQIALNGQAVDPGSDDQATLTYQWSFGDGTPGAGGASTSHAYANPGDYTATLTVCDDHVCDTDTTAVHVRKRTTFVSYTGTNAGTFSAQATLQGSIVDELGLPVVGGTLSFDLAGQPAGSAQTNAGGDASRLVELALPQGTYVVGVSYAGSGFYDGGNTAEVFDVARMASAMQYTGAVSGGAHKTVNLSAKPVDGLNRALAGKTVVFQLGTQQITGVTSSTGVATAALKLNQKNGNYSVTATWDPTGGDAARWTGSTAAATFILGGSGK